MNRIVLILILACFLISCVSKRNNYRSKVFDQYIVENQLESKTKIYRFLLRGWNFLDNQNLILKASHNKSYLVSLFNYCNDLDFAIEIQLDQSNSSQLSSKFDAIILPKQHFGQKCRIKSIHQITKHQVKELLALKVL